MTQWPQEPCPDFHQEALPCPVIEDLPSFQRQEVEDLCPSTSSSAHSPWDSSSAWDSDSSEADGHFWFVPVTTRVSEEEEERVNVVTVLKNIQEQLQGREKELIQELLDDSPPSAVLANSLIAAGNLSYQNPLACTMTPALEPELETHFLRAALHAVFTLGTEKDTTQVQDLHRVLPDLLDAMLGNLLAESPDPDRLHYILEHINYCIVSRVSRERGRSSTALLRSIISLSEFEVYLQHRKMTFDKTLKQFITISPAITRAGMVEVTATVGHGATKGHTGVVGTIPKVVGTLILAIGAQGMAMEKVGHVSPRGIDPERGKTRKY
ncbi:uncharacterized protein LOC127038394 [Gopherus flavomarginatus]|uniref:uncharacterized protein LOC127038394 n=1 Tax=Gopherus flavomarginatus TaxID=286002 RepID=UPI0021CC032A|nr:uncharacterized protein LOC127038394 [Gopherus flavomarginatus]